MIIDNANLHSITIYKHEMDLKLYALTFKVGKCMTRTFKFFFIKIQVYYKFKYIAKDTYNKIIPLVKQNVITNMINHNNQI
jgi:hypothetical protein